MRQSIDIIVPSYRLEENILINIFSLKRPENFLVNTYLIADNPEIIVPDTLYAAIKYHEITLLVNQVNLGFSLTRNKGIDAGHGDWILLLDDDIIPDENLLIAYAEAITEFPDSIGFAGSTKFPKPINSVTKSLYFNGSVGHFSTETRGKETSWTPTANVLLSRKKLGKQRFLPNLKNGGEDIELLYRNSFVNSQKYISIPEAFVTHPWWDGGKNQRKRMFRYGKGLADIIDLPGIKAYTFYDFTSTSESIAILILAGLVLALFNINSYGIIAFTVSILCAEFITNVIRSKTLSGIFSLSLAWQMFLHKNSYELGAFYQIVVRRKIRYLFKRLDVGFNKPNPGHFRFNRWKIIKSSLILLSVLLYFLL